MWMTEREKKRDQNLIAAAALGICHFFIKIFIK